MSQETSEEKSLPPSERKLRKAREKGQISKSSDMVAATTVVFLTIYLLLAWPSILDQFGRMFDVSGRASIRGGAEGWRGAIGETTDAMAAIIVPIYCIGALAIVLGSIISNKGVIFSFHPIKPDLKRVHPVEGFKRIFSVRNFVEFIKALVKSVLLVGALGLSAWYGLGAVLRIPYCGADCTGEALTAVAAPLIILALLLFVFAAMIDTNIQKWLFTRDMKMTHTEFKREHKEQHGDPLIRSERRKMRQEAVSGATGPATKMLKSRVPTILICAGNEVAVALRYVQGETPAPVVVGKGTGKRASELIELALDARIPVENDTALAQDLLKRARMESFIPETFFREVARVINQSTLDR